MAQNKTEVANLSLTYLGLKAQIQDLDTEQSPEARAIRVVYDQELTQTFEDFPWPFALKFGTLTLVEEGPLGDEWGYSHRYPADCAHFKRILSGVRNEARDDEVPFRVISDDNGKLILSDIAAPTVEYCRVITIPSRWSSGFVKAFAYRLAAATAARLTGGDPGGLAKKSIQLYQLELSMAQARAHNEEKKEEPPQAKFHRARR